MRWATWSVWLRDQYPYVALDAWVVMLNHLHGIVVLMDDGDTIVGTRRDTAGHNPVGARRDAPLRRDAPKRKPLGQLIGAFKIVSTKQINNLRGTPGARFWQRDYYEHIVRDEHDLNRIRQYIINNPDRWEEDRDNLTNIRRLPPPAKIEDYLADMARNG